MRTATLIFVTLLLVQGLCVGKIAVNGRARVKIDMYFTQKHDERVQIIKVFKTYTHGDFNSSRYGFNDVGMVLLSKPILRPRPAELAQPEAPAPTGQVFMIGWGEISSGLYKTTPEVLQYAQVTVMRKRNCQVLVSDVEPTMAIDDSHVCSYSPGKGITSCTGDSGGPLIRFVDFKIEVVGIISWSVYPCGIVGAPTVSMRVSHFIPWINDTIARSAHLIKSASDIGVPALTPSSVAQQLGKKKL